MKDIQLESGILNIESMPANTKRIQISYGPKCWTLRCYDEGGRKLATLVFTDLEKPDFFGRDLPADSHL